MNNGGLVRSSAAGFSGSLIEMSEGRGAGAGTADPMRHLRIGQGGGSGPGARLRRTVRFSADSSAGAGAARGVMRGNSVSSYSLVFAFSDANKVEALLVKACKGHEAILGSALRGESLTVKDLSSLVDRLCSIFDRRAEGSDHKRKLVKESIRGYALEILIAILKIKNDELSDQILTQGAVIIGSHGSHRMSEKYKMSILSFVDLIDFSKKPNEDLVHAVISIIDVIRKIDSELKEPSKGEAESILCEIAVCQQDPWSRNARSVLGWESKAKPKHTDPDGSDFSSDFSIEYSSISGE